MKKFFNLVIISVFLLSTLTVPQISVEAAAGYDIDSLQDGTYTLNVEVLQESSDETSAAAQFLDDKVSLVIENEQANLTITAPDNPMMNFGYLEIDNQRVVPDLIDGQLVFQFTLNSLREIIDATTSYEVPAIGLEHDDVGLRFKLLGLENIPEKEEGDEEVEEPETPVEPEKPTNPETPTDPEEPTNPEEEIEYADLDYAVDVAAMERYIDGVTSFEKDGQKYVTVQFNSAKYIANYEVDSGSGLVNAEREEIEDNKVNYTFTVDAYDAALPTKITIDAMGREMVHEFTLALGKEASVEKPEDEIEYADLDYAVDVSAMEGFIESVKSFVRDDRKFVTIQFNTAQYIESYEVNTGSGLTKADREEVDGNKVNYTFAVDSYDVALPTKITIDARGNMMEHEFTLALGKEASKDEPEDEIEAGKYIDGVYELPFNVLQGDSDDESTMTNFVENPATLTVKDGKTSVKVTLKSSSMIDYLQVLQNGEYVDATDLSNSRIALLNEKDTRDVEFDVADIDEVLLAKVKVNVPGMYDTVHDVRFVFDTSDIPLVNSSETPKKVAPVNPKVTQAVCGENEKPRIELQNTKGIDYAVQGDVVEGNEVKVIATPKEGYVLKNTNGWNKESNGVATKIIKLNELNCKPVPTGKYLDGEFELPFEILRGDSDATSTMGDYVNTPARVVIKDGEATVHVTTEFDSNLNGFKTQFKGKLVDAKKTVIGDNVAEYAFKVEELDALLPAQVSVHVPGIYNETYDVRFKFDTSNLERNPDYVPGKPGFGDAEKDETLPGVDNNSNNPKTGDNAPVVVYSLLFVLSLIMLVVQYRRKLV